MDTEEALDMTEVAVEDIGADIEVESAEQERIPARTVSNDDIKSEHNYSAVWNICYIRINKEYI